MAQFVASQNDVNESPIAAAIRRAAEEKGLTVDQIVRAPAPARIVTREITLSTPSAEKSEDVEERAGIEWVHDLLGSLTLSVDGYNLDYSRSEDHGSWARLKVEDQPSHINVQILRKLAANVTLLHVSMGSKVQDYTFADVPVFQVPVTWNGNVPHTRRTDIDNIDIILLDRFGRFIEVQVSITTRAGKFYLNLQEIYAGHVARTTVAKAKAMGLNYYRCGDGTVAVVVPLMSQHAYPGSDYLKTWKAIGNQLVETAVHARRSVQLSQATLAQWEPPAAPQSSKEGRMVGIVLFFNAVIGWGFIRGTDGKSYFIYFGDVQVEYIPFPMELYEFTPGKDDRDRPKAFAARRVKPKYDPNKRD